MVEFDAEWVREILDERFTDGGEAFDRWLAKRDAEVAAKALEEAASAWQVSGWAHDLPEKGAERAQVILHMAQGATEMLRLRAAEYRKEQGNE